MPDSEGRYLFLKIKFPDNSIWTLANIYAPNSRKEAFFNGMFETFSDYAEGNLLVMGDFNAVMDPKKDTSKKHTKGNKFPKSTKQHLDHLFLTDVWRERNKEAKGFTYYSNRHNLYSRIDQIWASRNMLTLIKDINILPIYVSDYSPIKITVWQRRCGSRRWRTDNNILKDPNIVKIISEDLKSFFRLIIHKMLQKRQYGTLVKPS